MAGSHHHWVKHVIHDFEENPATQVKFHWVMMIGVVGAFVAEWIAEGRLPL